ncbi:slipin family protein [Marinilabiliaceae bacterium JC017]|nr:slipin family protein [Marinilabiliaceae bacterium JC017]
MRRVRINKGNVVLVFRHGDFNRVLTTGSYWLKPFETTMVCDMSKPFSSSIELNILLQNEQLASLLEIVEVRDNEIALQYENGNFKSVLTPGRHAFWKGATQISFVKVNLDKVEITGDISLSVLKRPELYSYIRVYTVESYEQGLLFVDGKFERQLEKGVYHFWKNGIPVSVMKVDMRQMQLEVSGQEILTKDKAALRVNFFARYKVVDVMKALTENKEYERQLYIILQLAIREFIGTLTLDELLEKKEEVAVFVLKAIAGKVKTLGVEVLDGGVRDIILPGEVREIMNQVLVAQKKAQANIITRREETASTRSLLNTAKLMEENEMLFKLKEREYVEKIAEKINNITVSGGSQVVDQLKNIFTPNR